MSIVSWWINVKPEPFDKPHVEIGVDRVTRQIVVGLHQHGERRGFIIPADLSRAVAEEVLRDGGGNG